MIGTIRRPPARRVAVPLALGWPEADIGPAAGNQPRPGPRLARATGPAMQPRGSGRRPGDRSAGAPCAGLEQEPAGAGAGGQR